jgi:hypothetical protein
MLPLDCKPETLLSWVVSSRPGRVHVQCVTPWTMWRLLRVAKADSEEAPVAEEAVAVPAEVSLALWGNPGAGHVFASQAHDARVFLCRQ